MARDPAASWMQSVLSVPRSVWAQRGTPETQRMRAVVMTTPPRGPRGLRIMWGSPEGAIPAKSGYPAPAATPSPASAWALADNSGKRQCPSAPTWPERNAEGVLGPELWGCYS